MVGDEFSIPSCIGLSFIWGHLATRGCPSLKRQDFCPGLLSLTFAPPCPGLSSRAATPHTPFPLFNSQAVPCPACLDEGTCPPKRARKQKGILRVGGEMESRWVEWGWEQVREAEPGASFRT